MKTNDVPGACFHEVAEEGTGGVEVGAVVGTLRAGLAQDGLAGSYGIPWHDALGVYICST